MKPIELYIGLDVHKDSTTISIAEPGPKGEIRFFGAVSSDIDRLEKALRRIGKAHPNAQLQVAYEAGPCGFVIARRLRQLKPPQLHWFEFQAPDRWVKHAVGSNYLSDVGLAALDVDHDGWPDLVCSGA